MLALQMLKPRLFGALSSIPSRCYTATVRVSGKAGMSKWYPVIGEPGEFNEEYLKEKEAGIVEEKRPPLDLDDFFENLEWEEGPEKPVFPLPFDPSLPLAVWQKEARLEDGRFSLYLDKLIVAMQRASGLTRPQIDAA